MKGSLKKYATRRDIPIFNVMCYGAMAGVCLWLATFPHDVIKSCMQADQLENRKYPSLLSTIKTIHAEKGVSGFFKGLTPCLVRAPPINAATFLTFETVQKLLKKEKK